MLKIVLALSLASVGVLMQNSGFTAFKFQQNDYNLTVERYVMTNWSKKHFHYFKLVNFKHNRTTAAFNLSFAPSVEIGNNMQIITQVYKFLSNEYRYFPIRFQISACDAIAENAIGAAKFLKCGNFSGCPIKKNLWYHVCNFAIDQNKFPPLVPNGQYKADVQGLLHGEDIGTITLFGTVSRQVPVPEK